MSEEPEIRFTEFAKTRLTKYATGCLYAFGILFGLGFIATIVFPKKDVDLRVRGQIQAHVFDDPTFTVTVWHQHEGDLKKGRLVISLYGQSIRPEDDFLEYSFESWSPNEQNAVINTISLPSYDPNEPVVVKIFVRAANGRPTWYQYVWQNGAWQN